MKGIRLTNSEIQRAKYLKQKYDTDSTPNYLSLQSKAIGINEIDERLVEAKPIIQARVASRQRIKNMKHYSPPPPPKKKIEVKEEKKERSSYKKSYMI